MYRLIVVVSLLATLAGCTAAQTGVVSHAAAVDPLAAETHVEALYAEAMAEALDTHARAVETAAHSWYDSYSEAWEAHLALRDADLRSNLQSALEARGRTMAQLDAFADAHPEFVHEQNELYRERLAELRPAVFAVMGRIDSNVGQSQPSLEPAPEPISDVEGAVARADLR